MHRLRAPRPLLEGPVRRAAKRIERLRAEVGAERVDHAPTEAIERMLHAVARLGTRRVCVPTTTPGDADQYKHPNVRKRAVALGLGEAEPAAGGKAGAVDRGNNRLEGQCMRFVGSLWTLARLGCHRNKKLAAIFISTVLRPAFPSCKPEPEAHAVGAGRQEGSALDAAYVEISEGVFQASPLTRGPWNPDHQHAGPPSALICRAIERAAAEEDLTHLGRLTVNLFRPAPIGDRRIETTPDYLGRSAGHYSGRLIAEGKEIARFTALMQREDDVPIPDGAPGHPPPRAPKSPNDSPAVSMRFQSQAIGYGDLIENRLAEGRFFNGPSAAWFRMNHPLVKGEAPSPYQRVAVAADSGNGISAALDFGKYVFVNCDLTINLFRRPVGEWICLQSRSLLGGNGCGLAESALYDEQGLIGRATQSLAVRKR